MAETRFRRINATLTIAAAIAFLLAFAQPVFGEQPVMTTEGEDFTTLEVQNRLDPQHPEFNSGLFLHQTVEVPRLV